MIIQKLLHNESWDLPEKDRSIIQKKNRPIFASKNVMLENNIKNRVYQQMDMLLLIKKMDMLLID